jgi:hypothetical protein
MTSFRQIEANRSNALKSTGPTTDTGKQRSRRNAVRHGLTAETVIRYLEDAEDYQAFELSVTSGFDAPTAVERELVLRLASLLWRLRRATAIETGLLQIQGDIIRDVRNAQEPHPRINGRVSEITAGCGNLEYAAQTSDSSSSEIARCFLRLANVDNGAFERANRYETALWRQVGQVLLTLDFLRRTR